MDLSLSVSEEDPVGDVSGDVLLVRLALLVLTALSDLGTDQTGAVVGQSSYQTNCHDSERQNLINSIMFTATAFTPEQRLTQTLCVLSTNDKFTFECSWEIIAFLIVIIYFN